MADDADNVIALGEAVVRLDHAAERLVAEDQSFVTARCLAVVTLDDFAIRAADAKRDCLDQERALGGGRLRHIAQFNRIRVWRTYGDGAQKEPLGSQPPRDSTRVAEKSSRLWATPAPAPDRPGAPFRRGPRCRE